MVRFIALMIVCLTSVQVFASSYHCAKRINADRRETAVIEPWPRLLVTYGYHECKTIGTRTTCGGSGELIAHNYSICFQPIDVLQSCRINESKSSTGESSMRVDCMNGSSLIVSIDARSQGAIYCYENGILRRAWNAGTCTELQ